MEPVRGSPFRSPSPRSRRCIAQRRRRDRSPARAAWIRRSSSCRRMRTWPMPTTLRSRICQYRLWRRAYSLVSAPFDTESAIGQAMSVYGDVFGAELDTLDLNPSLRPFDQGRQFCSGRHLGLGRRETHRRDGDIPTRNVLFIRGRMESTFGPNRSPLRVGARLREHDRVVGVGGFDGEELLRKRWATTPSEKEKRYGREPSKGSAASDSIAHESPPP